MTKIVLKTEDNAHLRLFPRESSETIKTTGKQEVIHSSANATNKHNQNCDQVSKGPETSQLSSVLATITQELGEVAEFVHQGTIYSV